jgi:hypothetical protein
MQGAKYSLEIVAVMWDDGAMMRLENKLRAGCEC